MGYAQYINPPNTLKEKVGQGGLATSVIEKAQSGMERQDHDFATTARTYLMRIDKALKKAETTALRTQAQIEDLIYPVMQIKAGGGMFNRPLMSEVAHSGLDFLENIQILDEDALDIIRAHFTSLHLLLGKQKYGSEDFARMLRELNEACQRYYQKNQITA